MPRGSSPKRERQYEHILDAERDRGVPKKRAEEIAARTVNKARARTGEAKTASRLSKTDISSQQRAGYRRTHGGSGRTPRPALRRGEAEEHPRPLPHDESAARPRGALTLTEPA